MFEAYKFCQFLLSAILGLERSQLSEKFLNDQEVAHNFDETLVDNIFPSAKWLSFAGNLLRIFLLMISFKKPSIIKVYIHMEILMLIVQNCMPDQQNFI